jgi:hypothetical protein
MLLPVDQIGGDRHAELIDVILGRPVDQVEAAVRLDRGPGAERAAVPLARFPLNVSRLDLGPVDEILGDGVPHSGRVAMPGDLLLVEEVIAPVVREEPGVPQGPLVARWLEEHANLRSVV